MLLVGYFRLLPSGEPGLAVLLQGILVLFLATSEVGPTGAGVCSVIEISFQSLLMFFVFTAPTGSLKNEPRSGE